MLNDAGTREPPVLYLALIGGTPRLRDLARETWLSRRHVRSIAEGACLYSFFVAIGEREAAEVQAHEHEDTVAVPNRAPTELRDTWWARAWGVDGNASSAYVGPKTVGSGGRWLFVLVHAMRHALHVAPGLGYFFKPEMDGITCVDGMVATLRVAAAAWRHPWFAGYARSCNFDEAFALYSGDIVAALAGARTWEHAVVPSLPPVPKVVLQPGGGTGASPHGRYVPLLLRWYANRTGTQPWTFATHAPGHRGFVYIHSGVEGSIELQWRHLNGSLARGRNYSSTLTTNACNVPDSFCAVQKLSCRHVFFAHKIKDEAVVRSLWEAQLREAYDYAATAAQRLRELAGLNITKGQKKCGDELERYANRAACLHARRVTRLDCPP